MLVDNILDNVFIYHIILKFERRKGNFENVKSKIIFGLSIRMSFSANNGDQAIRFTGYAH